ncbi:tyrosinase family oxidase copper chaperone [Streptomyces sp. NPDC047000]|uniref:tyrosinase family oxidase copper chaperone n=1 Tax=Streptomyces sp. NPDC047000 TaxID=3155474 RepID=UPI0033FED8C5
MAAHRSGPDHPPRRRDLARGLLATAAALLLTPLMTASRSPQAGTGTGDGTGARPRPGTRPGTTTAADDLAFAETYRGRRIKGVRTPAGRTAETVAEEWQVTVDGRPLHLMRRADGSWLSMIDHYRSYPTPLAAARAAVDEMGPRERLRDLAPGPMDDAGPRTGGHHTHLNPQAQAQAHRPLGGDRGVHA